MCSGHCCIMKQVMSKVRLTQTCKRIPGSWGYSNGQPGNMHMQELVSNKFRIPKSTMQIQPVILWVNRTVFSPPATFLEPPVRYLPLHMPPHSLAIMSPIHTFISHPTTTITICQGHLTHSEYQPLNFTIPYHYNLQNNPILINHLISLRIITLTFINIMLSSMPP